MSVVDPKEEAQAYLNKHALGSIFENLQAHILFERPANVREFMIEYLSNLKKDEEGVFDKELAAKEVRTAGAAARQWPDRGREDGVCVCVCE